MWMVFVIIVDPARQLLQNGQGIRTRLDAGVVALEGFHEGLADPVALWAEDGCEAGHQGQRGGEFQCLTGGISGAVVRQPLNGMWCPQGVEPSFDAGQHEVAHHFTADAAGAGLPGDDFSVAGVDGEDEAHDLAIPAADFQAVGRPAVIGRQGNNAAFMRADRPMADMRLEQQLALRHEAKDTLVVDRLGAGCAASAVQERRDPPIAVSRTRIGQLANGSQQFVIALPLIAAAGFGGARKLLDEMRPGDAERVGYNFHREASRGGDGSCQTGFFLRRQSWLAGGSCAELLPGFERQRNGQAISAAAAEPGTGAGSGTQGVRGMRRGGADPLREPPHAGDAVRAGAAAPEDGQTSIRHAVAAALPGVAHQLCQFHFLREAANPVYEADRHAKKELKKQVRGVRPIERATEGESDAEAEVVRGYCAAVRSAITDDGRTPLAAPGLKLKARLEAVADSLGRLEAKRGSRRR